MIFQVFNGSFSWWSEISRQLRQVVAVMRTLPGSVFSGLSDSLKITFLAACQKISGITLDYPVST